MLDVAADLKDCSRQGGHSADAQFAGESAPDDEHVSRVVAHRADGRKKDSCYQLAAEQLHVLLVNAVVETRKPLGQEISQPEKLEFFGSFLATAQQSQIIELPADGS